jgi:membrane-bound lytic murein transglycosylase B
VLAALAAASSVALCGATEPGAQPAPGATPSGLVLARPAPGLPGLPATAAELGRVEVDSPGLRRAERAYTSADQALAQARDERVELDRARTEAVADDAHATWARAAAGARASASERRLAVLDGAIQELVVSRFVDGAGNDRLQAALLDPSPSVHEAERRAVLATASLEVLLWERQSHSEVLRAARAEAEHASGVRTEARRRLMDAAGRRPAALDRERELAQQRTQARVAYEEARVLAQVVGVRFPLVALDAYWRAAAHMTGERPACRLGWWALAGISRVEGRHGTYGGSSLLASGQTTRAIIGIPLDGTNNTRAIPDTDGGALDGDPVWDRAVGPMQFIPTTWARFRADGDDNGQADPHNLYDATLAAARYLCRTSSGLDGDEGLRRAFFAYNNSMDYVERVLSFARGYEGSVEIPRLAMAAP